MSNKIASNAWILNRFGVGRNNNQCPTRSIIEGYGCTVSEEYSYGNNQLVKEDHIGYISPITFNNIIIDYNFNQTEYEINTVNGPCWLTPKNDPILYVYDSNNNSKNYNIDYIDDTGVQYQLRLENDIITSEWGNFFGDGEGDWDYKSITQNYKFELGFSIYVHYDDSQGYEPDESLVLNGSFSIYDDETGFDYANDSYPLGPLPSVDVDALPCKIELVPSYDQDNYALAFYARELDLSVTTTN